MITKQNYVGRGPNASSSEQTAENAISTQSTTDSRQNISTPTSLNEGQPSPAIRQDDLDYYLEALDETKKRIVVESTSFFALDGHQENAVTIIARLLETWVLTEYKRAAQTNTDADMDFYDNHVSAALGVICLTSTLRDLSARVDMLDLRIENEEGKSHE